MADTTETNNPNSLPSQLTHPVVEGDFLANDDDCCQANLVKKVHSCWSGYFSSFPALKLALRKLDAVLRHAEIMSLLATPKAAPAVLAAEAPLSHRGCRLEQTQRSYRR